jgi:glutamate-1-semialdehyde 2,1-aminomutase
MAAGLWSLGRLTPKLYRRLRILGARLAAGLAEAARGAGIPLQVNVVGSLLTPFFTDRPVRDFQSATSANTARYAAFFREMLGRGVYLPPSQFEAWFLSAAHTLSDVDRTVAAARVSFQAVARSDESGRRSRVIE